MRRLSLNRSEPAKKDRGFESPLLHRRVCELSVPLDWSGVGRFRPAAGLYFKRGWCAVVDEVPADLDVVRYWDLAATEKTEFNDPDWTSRLRSRSTRNACKARRAFGGQQAFARHGVRSRLL